MRTTLELDDEVLQAARELARRQGVSLGSVVSELARRSLNANRAPRVRNGVQLFAQQPGFAAPTPALVNSFRDEE